MNATCAMVEATYTPTLLQGWQITGALAYDHSELIGYNIGGMITLRKYGILSK